MTPRAPLEPLYRIRTVARQVGVSEPLLRAWERRYALLKPRRTAGGYRAYSEADVALLRRVKQLTEEGLPISEAARLAPKIRRDLLAAAQQPVVREPPADRFNQIAHWRQQLVAEALGLDQERVEALLDEALAALPMLEVFDRVLAPALIEIGARWERGELSIAGEHLVSHAIRARLVAALAGRRARGGRHVLCTTLELDDHEIGLLGAALRFRTAGWRVTHLGPNSPAGEVGKVAARHRPDLVAVATQLDRGETAFREALGRLIEAVPPGTPVVVGGAAARVHAGVIAQLGAALVDTPEHWGALLGPSHRRPAT